MAVMPVPRRSPVAGSRAISLMPDQNEPKSSHHRPWSSTTRFGSMALKLSPARDSTTSPRWVQLPELPEGLVARKIADRLEPKVEAA
jgi:hypothetical protein